MSMEKLIARGPLKYAGRALVAGEEFEALAKHAKILRATRKAEPAPVGEPKRSSTYRRRDMKAES